MLRHCWLGVKIMLKIQQFMVLCLERGTKLRHHLLHDKNPEQNSVKYNKVIINTHTHILFFFTFSKITLNYARYPKAEIQRIKIILE